MNRNGYIKQQDVIKALETIKLEWQEAVGNAMPLDQVQGSVGLLLDDVMRGIGLEQEAITTATD